MDPLYILKIRLMLESSYRDTRNRNMKQDGRITLYHSGFQQIEKPDIYHGRKNADFGQGFYLSDDEEFARRWAKRRKGEITYINIYELDLNDLNVLTLKRNQKWFDYIYANRSHQKDVYPDADVIIGSIANDTIYDTFGISTSGILKKEEALKLLLIGPEYRQIVLKTQKAADQLIWIGTQTVTEEETERYKEILKTEQERFQEEFVALMSEYDHS